MALQFRVTGAIPQATETVAPPPDLSSALDKKDEPRDLETELGKGRSDIGPAPTEPSVETAPPPPDTRLAIIAHQKKEGR